MTVPSSDSGDGADKPLAGRTYVVSGGVPGYTRTTIAERIEALGGTASSSVSAKTTRPGHRRDGHGQGPHKAAQSGAAVIDPTEFAAVLAGATSLEPGRP